MLKEYDFTIDGVVELPEELTKEQVNKIRGDVDLAIRNIVMAQGGFFSGLIKIKPEALNEQEDRAG